MLWIGFHLVKSPKKMFENSKQNLESDWAKYLFTYHIPMDQKAMLLHIISRAAANQAASNYAL